MTISRKPPTFHTSAMWYKLPFSEVTMIYNSVCLDSKRRVAFFFTGRFILWAPLVSTNSTNPLFSQPWTIVQVSGIPAQHFILINWSLYRTLPLKLLRTSGTLPMMIAWDSWTYPVCPLIVRDRNSPLLQNCDRSIHYTSQVFYTPPVSSPVS